MNLFLCVIKVEAQLKTWFVLLVKLSYMMKKNKYIYICFELKKYIIIITYLTKIISLQCPDLITSFVIFSVTNIKYKHMIIYGSSKDMIQVSIYLSTHSFD